MVMQTEEYKKLINKYKHRKNLIDENIMKMIEAANTFGSHSYVVTQKGEIGYVHND